METETSETSEAMRDAFGKAVVSMCGNMSLDEMVAAMAAAEERARDAPRFFVTCRHSSLAMVAPLMPKITEALQVEHILPEDAIARAVAHGSATGLEVEARQAAGEAIEPPLAARALAEDLSMRPGWGLLRYPATPEELEAFQATVEMTGPPTRVCILDFPQRGPKKREGSRLEPAVQEANRISQMLTEAYEELTVSVQFAGKSEEELIDEICDAIHTGEAMPYDPRLDTEHLRRALQAEQDRRP